MISVLKFCCIFILQGSNLLERKKKNKNTEISGKSRLTENLETLLNFFGNSLILKDASIDANLLLPAKYLTFVMVCL